MLRRVAIVRPGSLLKAAGHKYRSKRWVNGKWVYEYDEPKKPSSHGQMLFDFDDKPKPKPEATKTPDKPRPAQPTQPQVVQKETSAAAEAPEGTPRGEAEKVTEELKARNEYVNDRASSVEQRGEDVRDSARHRALHWKGLSYALESEDADKLFSREFLLKQEPVDLIGAVQKDPSQSVRALFLHFALRKLPATPDLPNSAKRAYIIENAGDTIGSFRAAQAWDAKSDADKEEYWKNHIKKQRESYYQAYSSLRKIAEDLLKEDVKLSDLTREFRSRVLDARRGLPGRFLSGHEALRKVYNGLSSGKKTSPVQVLAEFTRKLMQRYSASPSEMATKAAEHAMQIMEGKSMNASFGDTQKREGTLQAIDFYNTSVMKRVGPPSEYKSVKQGLDMLDKHTGGKYQMRAIQWGKSVTDGEREHHLKSLADSFQDLADLLQLPPEMASYNGRLAIAVGARGRANALAHYEAGNNIINLTRSGGAGALAHEWGHFFDKQISDFLGGSETFLSGSMARNASDPIHVSVKDLMLSPVMASFHDRLGGALRRLHVGEKKREYWKSPHERFARCFERYVQVKLEKSGRKNTYLTGLAEHGYEGENALWPTAEEVEQMIPYFDRIFEEFRSSAIMRKSLRELLGKAGGPQGGLTFLELLKAARGGKYIRRVPYTDARGRQRYRYYYAEESLTREATEGEEIRVGKAIAKVLRVADDGTITLSFDGRDRIVHPSEWPQALGLPEEKFLAGAQRRAQQTINAVFRLVPPELLRDLRGETDEARLEELKRRVPLVYAKLQKAFARSGMSPFRSKQMLEEVLRQKRWTDQARAAVIGSVIVDRGGPWRQMLAAAENLAGGHPVQAKHAAAAVELVRPPANKTFASHVAETARKAEMELAKLRQLLEQPDGGSIAAAEVLAQALSSEAMQTLSLLAKAFPGLRDRALAAPQQAFSEIVAKAPGNKKVGAATSVYVAGEGGRPKALAVQYRLVEASELHASHNAVTFQRNEAYPEGVQERAYHRDRSEQLKVIANAQKLLPEFVANTNPDAINGPPMMTADGVVLGGNSRTMSMQRVYAEHPERAEQLRKYLAAHSHEFGFKPDDVRALKNPILVRELDLPEQSKQQLQLLVRQANEPFTQGMDPRTMQVAMGRRLEDSTLAVLADDMQEGETLNDFIATNRSERFVAALFRAGVLDQRNMNQYMVKDSRRLNADGRTMVSRILVGRMVGDADLLSNTKPKIIESIARSVPYIAKAKTFGSGYDLSDDFRLALDAYNDLSRKVDDGTIPALDSKMSKQTFSRLLEYFRALPGIGETHPVVNNARATSLLEVLIRKPGPVQMSTLFRKYADAAARNPEGQGGLFGTTATSEQLFDEAIGDKLTASWGSFRILSKAEIEDRRRCAGGRKLRRRLKWNGLDISVETGAGRTRCWHDPHSGESGETLMRYPYGYIRGSIGADGEHVDVYVGPHEHASRVFIVDQMKKPNFETLDEQKVMLGFQSLEEARQAYLVHYNDARFCGAIRAMPLGDFLAKVKATTPKQPLIRAFVQPVGRA